MKKLLAALMLCVLFTLPACAETMIANPWTETTPQEMIETLGLSFALPEGAENILYRMLRSESLAEAQFTLENAQCTARIKPAAEFEDISGMYYEPWDSEEDCEISWCPGRIMTKQTEEESIAVCLWYDVVPGLMYSVSASVPAGEMINIHALAEAMFAPAQGDADADAADILAEVLAGCTGYMGTAGSSLKEAIAAQNLLAFAKNHTVDGETFAEAVAALTEEQRSELPDTLESIATLIETAFAGYNSVSGLFDDAGVGETMSQLIQDEAALNGWTALRSLL